MKKCLAFLLLLAPLAVSAQTGTITYDQVVKMDIELPPEMESMRDQIPTESTSSHILYFTESETLMKNAPVEETEEDTVVQGGGVMIRMDRSREENETYTNLDEGTVIEKRDFMGRTFLVSGEQPLLAWKLTGEQSEYQGFAVQKATAERDSSMIEAWFSPEIPVSAGPDAFSGLPGLILVLSIDEDRMVFSAKEINLEGFEEGVLKAPKKGKKVSRDEFDEIVEEKMKEMETQFGGRSGTQVIIRHN